jgi:exopolysaccharide biosynthesis polyprenyl glycosylphosphotransferase
MQDVKASPAASEARLPFVRRHYATLITLSLLIADVAAILLAFFAAHRLRRWIPLPDAAEANFPRFLAFWPLLALQLTAILLCFFFSRMYHRRRTRVGGDELNSVFSGVSIGTLISIGAASFVFKSDSFDYSRVMVIYAWLLTIGAVVVLRGLQARLQRGLQRRGLGRTRAVLVGSGAPAINVWQRLTQTPRLGYDLLGVVPYGPGGSEVRAGLPASLKQLAGLDALSDLIARREADEVIVVVPEATDEDMLRIISRCDRSSISIKVYPDMFQIMAGQMTISELGGLPLLNVRDVNLRGWKLTLKRIMDIIVSGTFLVLASPLLILISLLIKLDSPGPVFFVQERMGVDGKRFGMIKYRSMRADAEKLSTWTVKDDPRRTRLGTALRRTNIDELPQFINVLLGDMSVVGPRPEQPRYVEEFRKTIPRYMERHREKSGITGWAQVNGLRGDTSIEERTQYDLWYVENWSVWLDVRIIIRTFVSTFWGADDNAY